MDEDRARKVADGLRDRGIPARATGSWVDAQSAVRVTLPDGREALWDTDGGAGGLEAQLLRDGVMVGFVPVIERSEAFTIDQLVGAIASADYAWAGSELQRTGVADGEKRAGGTLRRFIESFRE